MILVLNYVVFPKAVPMKLWLLYRMQSCNVMVCAMSINMTDCVNNGKSIPSNHANMIMVQFRVYEAVFEFKKAGLKLGVTTRGPRFMQSVYAELLQKLTVDVKKKFGLI